MSRKHFIMIMVLFILTAGLLSFLLSPFFTVRDFNVIGLNNLTVTELKPAVDTYLDRNIWVLSLSRLENRLENVNFVKNSSVERRYPASLQIHIEERLPRAVIRNHDHYLLLCEEGYILDEISGTRPDDVPLLRGFEFLFSGDKLIFNSELRLIMDGLSSLNYDTGSRINSIEYDSGRVNLFLEPDVPVYMGAFNEIEQKFLLFDSAVQKIENEGLAVDYIDLSAVNRPVIKNK